MSSCISARTKSFVKGYEVQVVCSRQCFDFGTHNDVADDPVVTPKLIADSRVFKRVDQGLGMLSRPSHGTRIKVLPGCVTSGKPAFNL